MNRMMTVLAALLAAATLSAKVPDTHRIMTCNIRVALAQDDSTGNGWGTRRAVCEKVMKRYKADVYCLQEVLEVQ